MTWDECMEQLRALCKLSGLDFTRPYGVAYFDFRLPGGGWVLTNRRYETPEQFHDLVVGKIVDRLKEIPNDMG